MPVCYGSFASPATLATPREAVVHMGTQIASSHPTNTMMQRIAYARTRAGISQTRMADLIGVHRDYYKLIEHRTCERIDIDHLLGICKAASVTPSWLIYGDDPPPLVLLNGSTIGQRLRDFRMQRALSAAAIAREAFGVKRVSSFSLWESGRMMPELRTLMIIADAYGIDVVSFIPTDP